MLNTIHNIVSRVDDIVYDDQSVTVLYGAIPILIFVNAACLIEHDNWLYFQQFSNFDFQKDIALGWNYDPVDIMDGQHMLP